MMQTAEGKREEVVRSKETEHQENVTEREQRGGNMKGRGRRNGMRPATLGVRLTRSLMLHHRYVCMGILPVPSQKGVLCFYFSLCAL